MVKMYLKLTLLSLILLLLTSCGFKDIDKRAFVVSMGIDKPSGIDKGYDVSIKIAIPAAESKEQSKDFIILTEEGKTIAEIVNILKGKVSNELDFGHMKTIILGDEIINDDLSVVMDWFTRRRDIQQIAYVAVGKPDAKTILGLAPKIERLPSNSLFLFFGETGTESPYVTTKYLFDFRRELKERGIDAYLPIVEANETGGFTIARVKISSKKKILLELDAEETKIFNILNKGYDKFNFTVEQGEGNQFVLTIDELESSYKIKGGKKPAIDYNITFSSVVEESTFEMDETKMAYYAKLAEETLKKEVENFLHKLQENNLDPLGFGLRYRSIHSGEEQEKVDKWNKMYPDVTFKVNVKANIKGTGVVE